MQDKVFFVDLIYKNQHDSAPIIFTRLGCIMIQNTSKYVNLIDFFAEIIKIIEVCAAALGICFYLFFYN